jgi:hypothetical protein
MQINIIERFNQTSLPKAEWTHDAHLLVGIWYLKKFSFEDAVCRLREKIILLNVFHGTENHQGSGYHETLTLFWLKVIQIYIDLHTEKGIETLSNDFLGSSLSDRGLPFIFYPKDKVLSPSYRAVYHEPDTALSMLTITDLLRNALP